MVVELDGRELYSHCILQVLPDQIINRYIILTMASTGNGVDFGDLTKWQHNHAVLDQSSTQRISFGGGYPSITNAMGFC